MSAKKELAGKDERIAVLETQLAESKADAAAHLRNLEGLAGKASRTDDAEAALARTHQDRDDAWKRVRVLQQQVLDRDVENAVLAEQNRGLLAVLRAMEAPAEEAEAAS